MARGAARHSNRAVSTLTKAARRDANASAARAALTPGGRCLPARGTGHSGEKTVFGRAPAKSCSNAEHAFERFRYFRRGARGFSLQAILRPRAGGTWSNNISCLTKFLLQQSRAGRTIPTCGNCAQAARAALTPGRRCLPALGITFLTAKTFRPNGQQNIQRVRAEPGRAKPNKNPPKAKPPRLFSSKSLGGSCILNTVHQSVLSSSSKAFTISSGASPERARPSGVNNATVSFNSFSPAESLAAANASRRIRIFSAC